MSFFVHKSCFFSSAYKTCLKLWKYYAKAKDRFSIPLSCWGSKMFALIRRFQIWSQNWVWIVFDPHFGRKKNTTQKSWKLIFWYYLDGFSAKMLVSYYPNSILRPYLESSHQGKPFRPPIWKQNKKCFGFHSIFKMLSFVRDTKKFLLDKNYVVLFSTSHGTELAPKTWKKWVRWKMKRPYTQARLNLAALYFTGSSFPHK